MPETPREYIKRIDEKWRRNEIINRKLIETIEWYDLLDERFKITAKQKLLDNFDKNQKVEQGWKKYTVIVSEIENIDKKYEELREKKEELKQKKEEREEKEREIKEAKLDGNETTLKMQMAKVNEAKKMLDIVDLEVKELEQDIKNMEEELKEIEETYGVKIESSWIESEESWGEPEAKTSGRKDKKFKKVAKENDKLLSQQIEINGRISRIVRKRLAAINEIYHDIRVKTANNSPYKRSVPLISLIKDWNEKKQIYWKGPQVQAPGRKVSDTCNALFQ